MIYQPLQFPDQWEWFNKRAPVLQCEDTQGLVVYRTGVIQAMAIFDSFSQSACNVHWVIDNPTVLKYGFFNEICYHAFINRDKQRIFGLVPSSNVKSLKLAAHIGMEKVAYIPDAINMGVGYVIMCMKRENCRWLIEEQRRVA